MDLPRSPPLGALKCHLYTSDIFGLATKGTIVMGGRLPGTRHASPWPRLTIGLAFLTTKGLIGGNFTNQPPLTR